MKEAVRTSETSVNSHQSTGRYDPEDSHLHVLELSQSNNSKISDIYICLINLLRIMSLIFKFKIQCYLPLSTKKIFRVTCLLWPFITIAQPKAMGPLTIGKSL
jgi:hypothetical protein